MEYSKGDWEAYKTNLNPDEWTICTENGETGIAKLVGNKASSSNAHLIAAAPDMREALKTIKRTAESSGDSVYYLQNALKIIRQITQKVIAKTEVK